MSALDRPIVHAPGWTIETHGNGYVLYSGCGPMSYGMNLVYMSEPDSNWESTKRLIESVPAMVRALKAIVNHQDMMGGELAKMSTTRHIAAKAILDATGEVV
jgi:hypothetical protein